MTHFIKITDKNLEFYLKKKEVSVIVLESDKKEVTVLSTANGKFTAAVSLDPIELKALYNSYINQLDSGEFFKFGKNGEFFLRKSSIVAIVKQTIQGNDIYHLTDIHNNRYTVGQLTQEQANDLVDQVI